MKYVLFLLVILFLPIALAASPTIDTVIINATSYDPTEAGTITVRIDFNVTDVDGVANLNNSACKCEFDNAVPWQGLYESASDTNCDNLTIDADTVQYTCLVDMQYWHENNTYSVNVTVKDNETWASNATETFVYNLLVASSLDTANVDFGTIINSDYGTNKTDANSPTTITNTGNKILSLKITGANLTDDASVAADVDAGRFFVDTDSDVSGAAQLTTSQQTITGASVPVEDSTPGGNTEDIWWFFNVPSPFAPGTYSGTWILEES